ncbi:MAG: flagellar assembly protein FliH, partial [Gammaproteobacteria bacterium]
ERDWKLVEDPTLSRGGCRVETESSRIDATVEQRLHAVLARFLGGERQGDPDETAPLPGGQGDE